MGNHLLDRQSIQQLKYLSHVDYNQRFIQRTFEESVHRFFIDTIYKEIRLIGEFRNESNLFCSELSKNARAFNHNFNVVELINHCFKVSFLK